MRSGCARASGHRSTGARAALRSSRTRTRTRTLTHSPRPCQPPPNRNTRNRSPTLALAATPQGPISLTLTLALTLALTLTLILPPQGPISIADVKSFIDMFKEKHDAMIKRVDESNNYSDLQTPWCSFHKIHGDMEQENEAASTKDTPQTPLHPERKMSKIVTTRSIFKTKKQELQEASLTPTLTLTLTPTPTEP